ncbi:PAS domain S-box-containing protein [Larkinella arboricola]|uniref:histidine kinase n=1 Tax=Larkinella arboricola TaxID=643671 RepID=A0A327WH67_LARAB|nr:PAS domain-containing protein [Larkinella arboricola]RAJ90699.1 PAS domain S-box-containing protein [Larkinella arboricola]
MLSLNEIVVLYNSIPTPCVILKPNKPGYTIAAVNRAFLSVIDRSCATLVGRHFFDAFPVNRDDDGSRTLTILRAFDHVLSHKTPHLIRYHRYDLPSSESHEEVRYWNVETYPLLDEAGTIHYIVQSSTDVTTLFEAEKRLKENTLKIAQELNERKQIEHELKVSNERYYYVNKATDDALYDWDIALNHIHWGEAFLRWFGYTPDDRFPLENWATMVHPEDISALQKSLNKTLENPAENNWKAHYRLRRPDGIDVFVEENGYILRDQQGRATRMIGVLRDISERKKAEAELESLKDTYSDLFHMNPLPMWVYDLDSLMFLDVNQSAIAHYGYTKEEFLSMSIRHIRPREDAEMLVNTIRNEVKPGLFHTSEMRHVKKSGEIIQVSIRGNSISYGAIKARMVVAIDITEKIKAEQALINRERRFKTLIQEGSDLIAIIDMDGYCKYVSPNIERLLGIAPEAFIGYNSFNVIHEADRPSLIEQFQLLNSKKQHNVTPFRYVDKQGKTYWVETVITDMRDDEVIGGIVCNSRIVTERVENELKIKEHLDRYNVVSKATSDAIWDMDMVSKKVLWNQGITAVFGYEDVENDYQWWHDHVHPEDVNRVAETVDDSIQNKIPRWTSEYRFRCADGSYKHVFDRGFLIFDDPTGQPVRMIGALQDITEKVAYTKAVEAHNVQLREIAWTQAHLVRAPLARILGLIPLLTDPENDEHTRQTALSYLLTSAQDLDEIIKEIINKSYEALKSS